MSESLIEKIKQVFGELDNEFKRIFDEIERGCFKRQIDVFDDFVSEVSSSETKVLKILEEEREKLLEKIKEFHDWLVQTEWRGVSSELLEEFQERFSSLFVEESKEKRK